MATPRKDTFDPFTVGTYHCTTRCVRQLFLLGRNKKAKRENTSRWKFCELRLKHLAGLFAVDVLDFALLSNHIHTLLRNRPDVAAAWSDREVARRWLTLHPTEVGTKEKNHALTDLDIENAVANKEMMTHARLELSNISHLQKCFLEPIAKEFNRRDDKRGHFVAERFRCKRIECEGAVLACSVYIALNAFRAGLGDTLQAHPHSSYALRFRGVADWLAPIYLDERASAYDHAAEIVIGEDGLKRLVAQANLYPSPRCSEKGFVPLHWREYQEIGEWTALHIRNRRALSQREKSEVVVPERIAKLLQQLGVDPDSWLDTIDRYAELFFNFVGMPSQLESIARRRNKKFVKGIRACRNSFANQGPSSPEISG